MNLLLRIVSAVVLLPVVVTLIHLGDWFIFGLCVVVAALALHEYTGIVIKGDALSRALFVALGTGLCALGMLIDDAGLALALTQLGGVLVAILFTLRTGDDFDTAWTRMATTAFGLLYITLAMVSVFHLRELGQSLADEWARPTWLYLALIATWSNDTFAYFAGRTFGRHKLYPKVSPGKTWEGFFGGVVGAVAMLFAFRYVFPNAFAHFRPIDLILIGVPAAALGPLGDLAESLLKRNYGVKDSGNTIPGHGGMLDRVDALFFVVPWVLVYALGIQPLLR